MCLIFGIRSAAGGQVRTRPLRRALVPARAARFPAVPAVPTYGPSPSASPPANHVIKPAGGDGERERPPGRARGSALVSALGTGHNGRHDHDGAVLDTRGHGRRTGGDRGRDRRLTLLTAYAETVAAGPDVVAHSGWKLAGGDGPAQWRSLTYRQVHEQVRDAALGLAATRPAARRVRGDLVAQPVGGDDRRLRGDARRRRPGVHLPHGRRGAGGGHHRALRGHRRRSSSGSSCPCCDSVRDQLPKLRAVVVLDDDGRQRRRSAAEDGTLGWPAAARARPRRGRARPRRVRARPGGR